MVSKENFKCLSPSLTSAKIKNLQKILSDQKLEEKRVLAEVLSGEVRFQILYLLANQGNLCVNDLADILQSKVSGVSHQLRVLRKKGLVKAKRKKKIVMYSLAETLPPLAQLMVT